MQSHERHQAPSSSPTDGPAYPRGSVYTHERRLYTPRLPAPAQAWLGSTAPDACRDVAPKDPRLEGEQVIKRAKYSGRALAEWSVIVMECNNFVERRRAEGVPDLKGMEVPTLSVEGFKRQL